LFKVELTDSSGETRLSCGVIAERMRPASGV
jgi:hypothetical protein